MSSYDANKPGTNFIHLGDEGLSDGDDLTPYVDTHFDSGNQVYIPPGTDYFFDGSAVSGTKSDCSLWGDPAGVECQRPDPDETVRPSISATGGEVLIENITIWGEKGEYQSRWRMDPEGGDIRVRNVNWPDGTVDPSDSQVFYSEGSDGTLYMENMYTGGHGNSTAYMTYGDAYLVVDGCTFQNSNTVIRPSPAGAEIRNTQWFADGHVPEFSQDGGSGEGAIARFVRTDRDCEIQMENIHAVVTNDCSDPGPVFHGSGETVTGHIDGFYLYNETSADPTNSWGDMSGENIHASGDGDLDLPWSIDGSESPDFEKTIWTPVGGAGEEEEYIIEDSPEYPDTKQGSVLTIDADEGTAAGAVDYDFTVDP